MAPAARWIVGIVLALVAFGLWTFWNPSHHPQTPVENKANAQGLAIAQNPATTQSPATPLSPAASQDPATAQNPATSQGQANADKQAMGNVEAALQPIVPKSDLAAPSTTNADEPVTLVYFDFDRSGLRADEMPKLDALAARIKGKSFDRLDAVGHADRIGEEPYNDQLSRKRADAVAAYLAARGVDARRIRAEAVGERESMTGRTCTGMGPDNVGNVKLVECLQRDRLVEIKLR